MVKTHISTDAFYDQMGKLGLLCDMESLMIAFKDMMGDSKMSGEILEVSPEKLGYTTRKGVEYLDDAAEKMCEMVHERSYPHQTP